MVTRNIILTENQAALIYLEDAKFQNLRNRLTTGLEQARRRELAKGSGEEAIRRAFAVARAQTEDRNPYTERG